MPKKLITRRGFGKDQLGNVIGKPQIGDTAKFHVKVAFIANRAKFKFGKKKFLEKRRATQFISTHTVGDTAFLETKITSETSKPPKALDDIVGFMNYFVQDMQLGEVATFTMNASEFKVPEQQHKMCKGHYARLGEDAEELIFEIDVFRIVRGTKEHHCENRYGTGARIPGSYSMAM